MKMEYNLITIQPSLSSLLYCIFYSIVNLYIIAYSISVSLMLMGMVEWKNPILEILSLYLKNGYLDGMNIH